MEVWKDIPGYNGVYKVSNLGRAKSLKFNKERILKPRVSSSGYHNIDICKNGTIKNIKIHQLVAMAFLSHIPDGHRLVVDHKNDIKTDNRLENLQIITQRSNICKTQDCYSSKYKGVYWYKQTKKWKSQISINNYRKHLGYFTDEYEAHMAYENAVKNLSTIV